MPRGCAPGERRGGKAKGKKNKATLLKEARAADINEKAFASGITPLEVMIETMRELFNQGKKSEASSIAKDAAPYMHPRLAAIEHSGAMTQEITHATKEQRDAAVRAALGKPNS